MSRHRGFPIAMAALITALLAILAAGPAAAALNVTGPGFGATASAASAGLTTTADARYRVDPTGHRVRVSIVLKATNHLTDTKTRRFFFERAFLAVQPETANFRITSPGAKPTIRVQARKSTYDLLRIEFGKQLPAGASRTFAISFDIPDRGGAATRTTRIGSSLVTFGAWGFGSEGAAGGSVTVIFPAGFTIDVRAADLGAPSTDADGNTVYSTGQLANALTFYAYFVADRPNAFHESTIQIPIGGDTIPITLRAWPDDPAWAKRVGDLLKRGMPALAAAIGLPWTAGQPLIVEEAVSRSSAGFAGRYNPPAGRIEIAYYADSFVILHEAAHAWFDGSLLADRWASEGFSSWYALQAAKAIGEKNVVGDALTANLEKVRVPLNGWGPPTADASAVEDAEYAASLKLAGLVAARAGTDGMQAVWRSIDERQATYQPASDSASLERSDAAPDWRGLLDLLQDRTGTSYDDLWSTWVVRPAEAGLLASRDAARTRYDQVVGRAGTWRLPRVVRDALRVWQYDQAGQLIDSASRALDDRDAVAAAATAAGLTPPSTMQTDFEGPRGFAAASAEAEAELAAIAAYRVASDAQLAAPNPLQTIGLWNASPSATLQQAASAFSGGDLRATIEASAFAQVTWQTAGEIGRNRVLAVSASLAAVLLGGWLAMRWYRDRGVRRRRRTSMAHR